MHYKHDRKLPIKPRRGETCWAVFTLVVFVSFNFIVGVIPNIADSGFEKTLYWGVYIFLMGSIAVVIYYYFEIYLVKYPAKRKPSRHYCPDPDEYYNT